MTATRIQSNTTSESLFVTAVDHNATITKNALNSKMHRTFESNSNIQAQINELQYFLICLRNFIVLRSKIQRMCFGKKI